MRTALPILAALTIACSTAAAVAAAPPPAASPASPASPAPSDPADVTRANDFNFAMYGALRGERGNLFFSATSMREALGIAYLGARGETAQEMARALHLDPDAAKSAMNARSEIADFNAAKGGASLSIANRLWVEKTFTPRPAFSNAALLGYGSPSEGLDFRGQPDPSRRTINTWVQKQTNDKIKDLLPADSVSADTRMVITNAIWFKGDWAKRFDKAATLDETFLVDGATPSKAPMMHQTSAFAIAATDKATMLEMRYAKSDLALDVLLPDSNGGIGALEGQIVSGGVRKWTSTLRTTEVNVSFPKLTFTWGGSIKRPLAALGMGRAFDGGHADLSGIADANAAGGNLAISDVHHKAFVAIDEEGTEAAAATAVGVAAATAVARPMPPIVFKADHPFIVVIRDTKQDRILFVGRVTNPKG